MSNIERAKELLAGDITCALVLDETEYTSTKPGIAPMMGFISDGVNLNGFAVADRIVGKAAANLFVLAGITQVYAKVLSKPALEFLNEKKVSVSYGELVESIINRAGTGLCPMEQTVIDVTDPADAYEKLKAKIAEMRAAKN